MACNDNHTAGDNEHNMVCCSEKQAEAQLEKVYNGKTKYLNTY